MAELTIPKSLSEADARTYSEAFAAAEATLLGLVPERGRLGFFAGRKRKAAANEVERCRRLAAEHPSSRWLAGLLACVDGRDAEALTELEAVCAATHVERVLGLCARLALGLGAAELGERVSRAWLEAAPADLDRMTQYARALLVAGQSKRALGVIANACKVDPNHGGARATAELVRKVLNGTVAKPERLEPL